MIFKLIGSPWIIIPLIVILISFAVFLLVIHWSNKRLRLHWLRRFTVIFLLCIICLRPSIPGGSSQVGMTNLDVFFVIDTTGSMAAEDFDGNQTRLTGVGGDIKAIVTATPGAKYSAITFNADTYIETPLTTDGSSVLSVAESLLPQVTIYATGSTVSQPLEVLSRQLEAAAKAHPERRSVVYFISDGEQTADDAIQSFSPIKKYVSGGAVLGYGTNQGARMKEVYGYSDNKTKYIKDYSSKKYPAPDAISKIDESNLRKVASQMGVEYVHRTSSQGSAAIVKESGVANLANAQNTKDQSNYLDIYWLFAIPAVLLLGYEAYMLQPSLRSLKKDWSKK